MLPGAPGDEFIQRVWILPEEAKLIYVLGTLFICGSNSPSRLSMSLWLAGVELLRPCPLQPRRMTSCHPYTSTVTDGEVTNWI